MKHLFATAAAVILSLSCIGTAQAQGRGTLGLGPRLGVYAHTGISPVYGIGAEVRYNLSDPVRLAPSLTWLFNSGCSVEAACDFHFMIRPVRNWYIYPLAGVSLNDLRGWNFGFDAGLGTDYAVARHIDLSAGLRWLIEVGSRRNPVVVWVGTTFKF